MDNQEQVSTAAIEITGHGEAEVEYYVTRCRCGDPLSHARLGLPCPVGAVEPTQTTGYRHRIPIVEYYWRTRFAVRRFIYDHFIAEVRRK